jgi:hypothetical protein
MSKTEVDEVNATAPVAAKAPEPDKKSVPALIVVPPVKVLAPVKVSDPELDLVREFVPPPIPVESVSVVPLFWLSVPAPVKVIVRAELNVAVVFIVPGPRETLPLEAPKLLSALICKVPLETAVPLE